MRDFDARTVRLREETLITLQWQIHVLGCHGLVTLISISSLFVVKNIKYGSKNERNALRSKRSRLGEIFGFSSKPQHP